MNLLYFIEQQSKITITAVSTPVYTLPNETQSSYSESPPPLPETLLPNSGTYMHSNKYHFILFIVPLLESYKLSFYLSYELLYTIEG